MNLQETISQELIQAMKDGQANKLGVLRLLKTSLKNEQIKLIHELSPEEALKVVSREAKQRRDSIVAYEAAKRQDLADEEKAELIIIEEYLPKQLSESDIMDIINQTASELGISRKAGMGQVMAAVMKKTAGAADGAVVSRLVLAHLD